VMNPLSSSRVEVAQSDASHSAMTATFHRITQARPQNTTTHRSAIGMPVRRCFHTCAPWNSRRIASGSLLNFPAARSALASRSRVRMGVFGDLFGWLIRNQFSRCLRTTGQHGRFVIVILSALIGLRSNNILKYIDNWHRMGRVYAAFNAQRPSGCSHCWEMSR